MISDLTQLSLNERREYQLAASFLRDRLQSSATVAWAIDRGFDQVVQFVLRDEVERALYGRSLVQPWADVWRLVFQSWDRPDIDNQRLAYQLEVRVKRGERTEALIESIVECVRPRLKVTATGGRLSRKPSSVHQLLSARLSSGRLIAPSKFGIDELDDPDFLGALARNLDAALKAALFTEHQIRPQDEEPGWRLGNLYRAYFVRSTEEGRTDEDDVDEFHDGIAPTVKLLHATVERLAQLRADLATILSEEWGREPSPTYLRLWAAIARDPALVPADVLARKLMVASDEEFWDIHDYPEIAEVRSARFGDLDAATREALGRRIRQGPPLSRFFRRAPREKAREAARYWAVRELRRIEVSGSNLEPEDAKWLGAHIDEFPDLRDEMLPDHDFSDSSVRWINQATRVADFGDLAGGALLSALEQALAAPRVSWEDDVSSAANGWLAIQANASRVVEALAEEDVEPSAYPLIWEKFGWSHSPQDNPNAAGEAEAVLSKLVQLDDDTIRRAINGLAYWFSRWHSRGGDRVLPVWMRLWPIAVEATNLQGGDAQEPDENASGVQEEIDALNNPVSRMIDVFYGELSSPDPGVPVFEVGTAARAMRDRIEDADRHAGVVANYRFLQNIAYFLNHDPDWAERRLLAPLREESASSRSLWYAVTYRRQSSKVIRLIGDVMLWRAIDPRMSREARERLVFSLVVECLHALLRGREPAVAFSKVQQMLRSVEEEVRGHGAWAVLRFLKDAPDPSPEGPSPEHLFDTAVRCFLEQGWPQEMNLVTPGVANHFAEVPAASGERFAEAVRSVERFLVPFDCWSMLDYGLWGDSEDGPRLSTINSEEKAGAFLSLLDRTVSRTEGGIVPMDLSDALRRIAELAPKLESTPEFRRLKAQARERA